MFRVSIKYLVESAGVQSTMPNLSRASYMYCSYHIQYSHCYAGMCMSTQTYRTSLVPRLSNYCAVMRGREREPGIHCKFTRLISREFYGFVNSLYSSVNDDASTRNLASIQYTLQTYYFIVRKRCQCSELY